MSPDIEIVTSTLRLRLLQEEDSKPLTQILQTSLSLHQWLDWCDPHFSQQNATEFILANRLNWVRGEAFGFGVFDKHLNQLLGMVAINERYHSFNMAAIGYWIGDQFQRKGYAKEAVQALAVFAFDELKISRLEIVCDQDNHPSQQFILSLGAQQECIARNRFIHYGEAKDGVVFSLIPSDISTL